MLGVALNVSLDVLESTSFREHVELLVNFGVLVIDLVLVEGVVYDSFAVHDESTLSDSSNLLVVHLVVVIILVLCWEMWLSLGNNLKWLKLSISSDSHKPPVVESALPELAEVEVDLSLNVINAFYISLLNLVPRQEMSVVVQNW